VEEKFSVKPEKDQKVYVEKNLKSVLEKKRALRKKRYSVSSISMAMRLFKPKGDLVMLGAPRNEVGQRANEFLRNVKMKKAFYVAEHEITEKQYQRIIGKGKTSNLPVTNVVWIDAIRFCNELSKREGLALYYTIRGKGVVFTKNSDGYRLPSESEWEWVSRKHKKRVPTIYSWGNRNKIPFGAGNIADESAKGITKSFVARYNDNHAGIAPVKSFSAEKNGLFDMFGNVSEWVGDYYSLNPYDSKKIHEDLVNNRPSKSNVIKGSSWKSSSVTELRASYREGLIGKREDVGFRIARNAE
jgi:formylglycine-generating enzyme required for sulfatase activity